MSVFRAALNRIASGVVPQIIALIVSTLKTTFLKVMRNRLETPLLLQLLQLSPHSFSVSAARCSNCCLCGCNKCHQNEYSKLKPTHKPSTENSFTNQFEFILMGSQSKSNRTSIQRPPILLDLTCAVFL